MSFKVTCGTVFHGAKIALQKWFLAISLIANAKKSLSSHQLARDLDLNQKTAWYMMVRIRAEMAKKGGALLEGIIEADETYIGGKPRKKNKRADDEPAKRGRGTDKDAIIGAVQRGGKVVAQLAPNLTGRTILEFIRSAVNLKDSELITDEFQAYNLIGKEMKHAVINHKEQFADGDTHTNTIEGFWSLLKRAWYRQHHHYQTRIHTALCSRSVLQVQLQRNGYVYQVSQGEYESMKENHQQPMHTGLVRSPEPVVLTCSSLPNTCQCGRPYPSFLWLLQLLETAHVKNEC